MSDASQAKRTEADIEADLQRTREELTKNVNELAERLSPKANAKAAGQAAKRNAKEFVDKSKAVAEDASKGDSTAIGILAGVVSTAALAGYLLFKK